VHNNLFSDSVGLLRIILVKSCRYQLLYKQFAESGKAQAMITLEANPRSVEQCVEKGLPAQPLKLRLIYPFLEV
jgi:hypothetical protein